jgi:hypothetical protein
MVFVVAYSCMDVGQNHECQVRLVLCRLIVKPHVLDH